MRFYLIAAFLTLLTTSTLCGQNLIVNGDFEADSFTTWPGYTGGGNPEEITGWIGQGNRGINPVFEVQNPAAVVGWTRNEESTGNIGINPVLDGRAPFGDNGDNDGAFLFLQGQVSAYQDVSGLTVGEDYVLSVDYNARNCCGDIPAVSLEINGDFISNFPDPNDFVDELVDPVLEGAWWFTGIPFTAEAETQRVEFFTEASSGGDATFLLDNISVEPAGGGDNLVQNGDFEADADAFATWPGYLGNPNAGPRAPFRDNGNNDTQVALLQVTSSIEQEITGLTPGQEYTLSLDFNSRNCCGDVPTPQLIVDDEPLDDFPFEDDEIVDPVGEGDWYSYERKITADFDTVLLRIQTMSSTEGGDSTFLVDNVFFGIPGAELPGDFDGNGVLEVADVDLLGNEIAAGSSDLTFDLNGDGTLTTDDLDELLGLAGKLNGDLDFGGDVGFSDFLVLSTNFNQSGENVVWSSGDLNVDRSVAFADFLIMSSNFGKSAAAVSSVPEPNGLSGLLLGGVVIAICRRRLVFRLRQR